MGRSSRRPLSAVPFFSALRRMWHHHSVMSHTSPSTSSFAPSTSPQPQSQPQPQSSQSQTLRQSLDLSNAPLDVTANPIQPSSTMANSTQTEVIPLPTNSAPVAVAESMPVQEPELKPLPQQQQQQQQQKQQKQQKQQQRQQRQQTPQSSGDPKKMNGEVKLGKVVTEDAIIPPSGPEKLTNAEIKKKAKAEKAARRAKERQEKEKAAAALGAQPSPQPTKKGQSGGGKDSGSTQKGQKHGAAGPGAPLRPGSASATDVKKREDKNVAVFGHLYGHPRRSTIAGAGKEVHPAVLALGLQIRDYVICGSNARCVATLLAFKRVIESYTTPLGTSLTRHLTTHLSHQITYLSTCRPLSISQGNAIRALKLSISSIDPSVPEATSKTTLCDFIDCFIREKITVADQVIASSAAQKIQDGDVIVTFAGSSIVNQTLLTAHKQNKKFRVSIIDSRPLFEGKNLARSLANAGLEVQYSLIHGISHAIKDATKVFLGAHAMTGNGRLYSRVGTALVAMSAKERSGGIEIPVIVCCETVKFTDRVALDSIVVNEIADADELVTSQPPQQVTGLPDSDSPSKEASHGSKTSNSNVTDAFASLSLSRSSISPLKNWRDTPNLQLLNIMYDVTPAEYVDMVITEMGSLPPSAVPVVHRMSTNS